ncbi:hypothetical protein [Litchfieldia alkalitelluris]|uniref:hypothetical protein n=1 Tax=Litchfieldia alkalitelluris TaxID=304268 RepID=UPI001958BDEB|nr:hypothetical protein [Litchfieldia alkalitelluris]
MNGEAYQAYWVSEIFDEQIRNKLAIFVHQFLHDEMIAKKKEYKKLPEPTGRYAFS